MAYADLSEALAYAAHEIYEVNRANGWYDDERSFVEECALIASEVFEAMESWRESGFQHSLVRTCNHVDPNNKAYVYTCDCPPKPEGVASELADTLIRLLDTAYRHKIDLGAELWRKLEYNKTRGYKHGGKRL